MGSAPVDPTTPDQELIDALRNLWPILNKASRTKAIHIVNSMHQQERGDQG